MIILLFFMLLLSFVFVVDFKKFFSKEAIAKRLKEAGKSAIKQVVKAAGAALLKELGLPEVTDQL